MGGKINILIFTLQLKATAERSLHGQENMNFDFFLRFQTCFAPFTRVKLYS